MAQIKGIEGMSLDELQNEINQGGRFIHYIWCISIVIMTFKRSSNIHFIKSGNSAFAKGLPFTLLTFVVGWWGFPWGPIYSLESIFKNTFGSIDVTNDVLQSLISQSAPEQNEF